MLSLVAAAWKFLRPVKPLSIWAFMALVVMPLFVTGMINVALAFQCILHDRYWFAFLFISGVGAFLSPMRETANRTKVRPDDTSLSPEAGHAPSIAELKRDLLKATANFAPVIVAMWPMAIGIDVFHALRALLLGPGLMPRQQFMAGLAEHLPFIWVPAMLVLWVPASVLVWGVVRRLRLWGTPDGNRPLAARELAQVEAACVATSAYADGAKLNATNGTRVLATLLAYGVAVGLGVLALKAYQSLPVQQPDLGELWFRTRTDFTSSTIAAMIAGMLALYCGLPSLVLAQIWPSYAERLGWHYLVRPPFRGLLLPNAMMLSPKGKPAGLVERLILLVRLHRLPDPFEARSFLRNVGRRCSRPVAIILSLAAIVSAYAVVHDWVRIDAIDRSGITIMDDWTLLSRHYDFRQVRELTLRCELGRRGGVYPGIVLQLPGSDVIDLAGGGEFGGTDLTDAVRIDDILRRQRTPVRFEADAQGKLRYSAACVRAEASQLQGADQGRVIHILHLEQWKNGLSGSYPHSE